jgi:2-polyprenyl-6-methoxyphenol hydroxylase-like FAD-dependent oxidoreductase
MLIFDSKRCYFMYAKMIIKKNVCVCMYVVLTPYASKQQWHTEQLVHSSRGIYKEYNGAIKKQKWLRKKVLHHFVERQNVETQIVDIKI